MHCYKTELHGPGVQLWAEYSRRISKDSKELLYELKNIDEFECRYLFEAGVDDEQLIMMRTRHSSVTGVQSYKQAEEKLCQSLLMFLMVELKEVPKELSWRQKMRTRGK